MRTVIIILVVLASVAAALFALGVFGTPPQPEQENRVEAPPETPTNGSGNLATPTEVPDSMPPLEVLPIREPLNVLLLAGYAERIPATLAMLWGSHDKVTVHAWVENAGAAGAGSGAPPAQGLSDASILDHAPIPADLRDLDIGVVAIHGLSADALDAAFWDELDARVKDGRCGLIVMPGRPEGQMLLDGAGDLVPVAKSARMEGDPVPGVLGGFRPFEVTDAGTEHPASRLVAWPVWSRTLWQSKATSEYPWGTSLTWPVEDVTESGTVLLRVVPAHGDAVPVMIAGSAGSGRVLFFGAFEIIQKPAYGRGDVMHDVETWVRNWLAWVSGQA